LYAHQTVFGAVVSVMGLRAIPLAKATAVGGPASTYVGYVPVAPASTPSGSLVDFFPSPRASPMPTQTSTAKTSAIHAPVRGLVAIVFSFLVFGFLVLGALIFFFEFFDFLIFLIFLNFFLNFWGVSRTF
jgi:hypothetical protein